MLNFFPETLFYEKMTINSRCMKWTEIGYCRGRFRLFIVSCHFQFIFIKGCYIIAGVCVINRGEWHCPGLWGFVFVGRWEGRQELPRSTSFRLIFLTFGGQEEEKTSAPFYCSWCPPLLKEVKTRLMCRVSQRSAQQKKIFTKIDCCGAKFTHGHDMSIVRND